MIEKIFSLGDWIFNHPVRMFIAAALWFAACIAGALVTANALHWLNTTSDWNDALFWGLVAAIMLPPLFCAVAEQLQELQSVEIYAKEEKERRRMYN